MKTPSWLNTDAPIPKHFCDDENCVNSDVRFLFHENNKSVYKCCFTCWTSKAVNKGKYLNEVTGHYHDFQCAKEAFRLEQWEAAKKREEQRQRDMHILIGEREDFLDTREWKDVRWQILKKYKWTCLSCGRKPPEVVIHVDHIKPRSRYPELALDPENLQLLCEDCNVGKSNRDEIDFRGGA